MSKTIQEHVSDLKASFRRLSKSYRAKLVRDAKEYCYRHPACADHSNFWGGRGGLSARQVIEANAE